MAKKRPLRLFCVEFSTFHNPRYTREDPLTFSTIQVQVQAPGVNEAKNIAARQVLTQFIPRVPKQAVNVCWSTDQKYPEAGYISVQYPRGAKLSAPYHMTRRMKVEVTLGNIPIQLCLDFGD